MPQVPRFLPDSGYDPVNAKKRARSIVRALRRTYPQARTSLHYRSPFELLIATILSAQSTDEIVNKVTPTLFERYPTPDALAAANPDDVEKIIYPTGFFRQKTKSIVGAARKIVEDYGGEVPLTIEELIKLPGVARKTANVVIANVCPQAEGIFVDTHIRRVAQRLAGDACRNCARRVEFVGSQRHRLEEAERLAQPLVDRGGLVVVEHRVDQLLVGKGVRRDRAVSFRSERTLVADGDERGEELALRLRPLGRALHHLLQELAERAPEELRPVAQGERDVGDVAVALPELRDLLDGSRVVSKLEPQPIASSAARRRRSPSASAAARTASSTTSASSPATSASTIRYACRRTFSSSAASSAGSSPRTNPRRTSSPSAPGVARIASVTRPHAAA